VNLTAWVAPHFTSGELSPVDIVLTKVADYLRADSKLLAIFLPMFVPLDTSYLPGIAVWPTDEQPAFGAGTEQPKVSIVVAVRAWFDQVLPQERWTAGPATLLHHIASVLTTGPAKQLTHTIKVGQSGQEDRPLADRVDFGARRIRVDGIGEGQNARTAMTLALPVTYGLTLDPETRQPWNLVVTT
jgi:hypothetical protein